MFDSLINILNSVIGQKRFCFDYFTRFSFEAEFNTLLVNRELNDQLSIGDVLEYYKITLKSTIQEFLAQGNKKIDNNTRVNSLMNFSHQTQGDQSNPQPQSQLDQQAICEMTATLPVNRIRMDDEITTKEKMIQEMVLIFIIIIYS